MSTLHERLLARIHRGDPYGVVTAWKAVRAAVERHAPTTSIHGYPVCSTCYTPHGDPADAPCDESRAIAEALGVNGG